MNQLPIPEIIEGPAILQIGAAYYESREDIVLKFSDEADDVSTLSRGVIAQRNKSRKIEATFTPIKWSDYSALFSVLSLSRGQRVFGGVNTKATIWGADGTKVELKRAAITAVSAIGCGISKERFSSFTLTALADPTSTAKDWSALMAISQAQMPALPNLTSADISTMAFVAQLCTNAANPTDADILIDLEEGAEVSFDLKLNERKIDRCGLFDYTMDEVVPSVKFKPVGITLENWQKLVSMVGAPRLGGVFEPAYDLILRGIYKDDPVFTFKKVVCLEKELKWSATESRMSEIELKAMGNLGLNKFTVGTCAENLIQANAVDEGE